MNNRNHQLIRIVFFIEEHKVFTFPVLNFNIIIPHIILMIIYILFVFFIFVMIYINYMFHMPLILYSTLQVFHTLFTLNNNLIC
jgi:hypothetical protein